MLSRLIIIIIIIIIIIYYAEAANIEYKKHTYSTHKTVKSIVRVDATVVTISLRKWYL